MKCSKCGKECEPHVQVGGKDGLETVSMCCSVPVVEEKQNLTAWKDLDSTTPLGVLMEMEKYQIQLKSTCDGWVNTEIDDEVQLFEKVNNGWIRYRYRLKPLEPVRIIRKMIKPTIKMLQKSSGICFELTTDSHTRDGIRETFITGIKSIENRPVEIID